MDAFKTHEQVISKYRNYLTSFINIADERIKNEVSEAFNSDGFIPETLVQFNPSFQKGDSLSTLLENNEIHENLVKAFGNYNLYKHQVEALRVVIYSHQDASSILNKSEFKANREKNYVDFFKIGIRLPEIKLS
jgi:hypothetical protein